MNFPVIKFLNFRKAIKPSTTKKMSEAYYSSINNFVETFEPTKPSITTPFPGPGCLAMNQALNRPVSKTSDLIEVIDNEKSFGNYFTDVDNNTVLDMHMSNGNLAFGYNSRSLTWLAQNNFFEQNIVNSTDSNFAPDHEYATKIHEAVSKFAPKGLHEVHVADSVSTANETAIRVALRRHHAKRSGKTDFSDNETDDLQFLSFHGGSHGSGFLSRNLSVPDGILPSSQRFELVRFPQIKFPYEENISANRQAEERTLGNVRELFEKSKGKLAGLIIEPVQIESIRYASSQFYNGLMDICKDFDVTFICDETHTAGYSSGRLFSHYSWVNENSPSIVTFGGRTRLSGFYTSSEYKQFVREEDLEGTAADLNDVIFFEKLSEIGVKKDWIDLHNASFKSSYRTEMDNLQSKLRFKVSNIRGEGKIFGFDVENENLRDEIVSAGRSKGFKVNPKGRKTIGFTPSLLFAEFHFTLYKDFLMNERFYSSTIV